MHNMLNGIAAVLCSRMVSTVTGPSEVTWRVIITLVIVILTWYSANYSTALEVRRGKRCFLLLARVVITILLNFIYLGDG